jgi:quercetin dioxygenase-like cupin family protein
MTSSWRNAFVVAAVSCAAAAAGHAIGLRVAGSASHGKPERARVVLDHRLPALDGSHLEATVVEVNYGPGESSPVHSHPCPVIGYVIEGAYRTQIKGKPATILKPGDAFYEAPNGVHLVSANASRTKPAKFVAFFICERHTPLSVDVPATKHPEEKQP